MFFPTPLRKHQIANAQGKPTLVPININKILDESPSITSTPTTLMSTIIAPTATPTPTLAENQSDFCLQVPVLYYHHIEPYDLATKEGHQQLTVDSNYFDQQMQYLRDNGYRSISAEGLAHALLNHQQLPPKTVVITMDDGYVDIYQYAFPILKKYNMIGSLMVPAGLVDNADYLTWSQLQEMVKDPHIRIYNHTYSHADIADADENTLHAEVIFPNEEFQTKLGIHIDVFTYPYGSFSDNAIAFLKQNGFIAAFSTLSGSLECESQIMRLPRVRIGNAPLSEYGF
jgi:peptidoglycan/xylan/chitin deacetylase (PgdA/CDA1 family)